MKELASLGTSASTDMVPPATVILVLMAMAATEKEEVVDDLEDEALLLLKLVLHLRFFCQQPRRSRSAT